MRKARRGRGQLGKGGDAPLYIFIIKIRDKTSYYALHEHVSYCIKTKAAHAGSAVSGRSLAMR